MNPPTKPTLRERLHMMRRRNRTRKRSVIALIKSHLDSSRYQDYNWWDDHASTFWLPRFIDLHLEPKKKINLFSCFQNPLMLIRYYKGVKIFLSGENLENNELFGFHPRMLDHRINEVDLALGFEFNEDPKYYRFPLWIYQNEFISPSASLEDIRTLLEQINDPSTRRGTGRSRFIGQISSHDKGGMRGRLIDLLSPIGQIDCAGRFRHNTDELLEVYGDDKFKFLANYRFDLCPENSLGEGYITEKVFDSIRSGCIPIYWGAYLEPGILNPKAILRFEEGKEQEFYDRVKELWEDEEAYEQFILEPPFVEGAAERIWELLEGLRERLAPLVE